MCTDPEMTGFCTRCLVVRRCGRRNRSNASDELLMEVTWLVAPAGCLVLQGVEGGVAEPADRQRRHGVEPQRLLGPEFVLLHLQHMQRVADSHVRGERCTMPLQRKIRAGSM